MSPDSNWINASVKIVACVCLICLIISYLPAFNFHKVLSNIFLSREKDNVEKPRNNCTVIVHNPYGRLGNILFEFAVAYGLALDHSCYLYLGPGFIKQLGQYFEINMPHLILRSHLNNTPSIKSIFNHCQYFQDLFSPNTSQHIELSGYWQVQKYFINHTNQIRKQLRFKQHILDAAQTFITTNVTNHTASTLVGIHIRRGDFIGMRSVSSETFIFDAMSYFTRKYRLVRFIIVSDDKSYCRNTFGKRNDTYFTPDSFNAEIDMAILTECDHIIITVGTYGWWSAFLMRDRSGEVITDGKPNHQPLDVDCDGSVFFPPWFSFLNTTK